MRPGPLHWDQSVGFYAGFRFGVRKDSTPLRVEPAKFRLQAKRVLKRLRQRGARLTTLCTTHWHDSARLTGHDWAPLSR